MRVAIAGASGLTGRLCLGRLIAHPLVSEVISIGRRPTGFMHPKLREIQSSNGHLIQPVEADVFISCIGTTIKKAGSQENFRLIDVGLPLLLAKHLKAYGCERAIVISAMGASLSSPSFYGRTKGEMEAFMSAVGFKTLTIFRPFFIEGPRQEKRFGETAALFIFKIISPLFFGDWKNYRTIKADDLARAIINAVFTPQEPSSVYLSGQIIKTMLFKM